MKLRFRCIVFIVIWKVFVIMLNVYNARIKIKFLLAYLLGFLMISKFVFAVGFPEDPIERFKIGKENAPVTFYMFFSLSCTHCADLHESTFELIKKNYIDKGLVKMVFIDLPMGGDMVALAHAMLYAANKESERLELMDMYFKNQQYWLLNNSPQSAIVSYAKLSGLDVDKVEKTLVNKDFLKKLTDSANIYVKKLGINGTPFMVISKGKNISVKEDKKLSGALPYDKIAAELDEFLKNK